MRHINPHNQAKDKTLNSRITMSVEKENSTLDNRYSRSNDLLARAKKVIPTGSQTFSKSALQFPVPYAPLFLERGEGGNVWDVDGNRYVDMISALLPVNLGYCDPDIDEAISQQLKNGISFSLGSELEIQLAEKMVELIPCAEMVRFGKNGTDATSAAIRLARAYTGKNHIIACGYHGWQDWYIGATTRKLGIPKAVQNLTHKCPYNDIDAIKQQIKKCDDDVAAIILELVSAVEPAQEYLKELRELATRENIILVFDEVITGFRIHMGGAQEYYGITPDLAAFGKGMGNGMPISAVVGRKDIMSEMENIFYSGTFGGETLSLAASIAVIDKMQKLNVIDKLWETGQTLADNVNAIIKKHGLETIISLNGLAPWKILAFKDHDTAAKEVIRTYFMTEMLKNGVLIASSHNICYAHTEKDIGHVTNAYDNVLQKIADGLHSGSLKDNLLTDPIYPVFQVRDN